MADEQGREGEAPPAARVVLDGERVEGEAGELARLKLEADELRARVKARETRVSELEAENQRLKNPPTPAQTQKRAWLEGWKTILD
jgi:hypothetical protein